MRKVDISFIVSAYDRPLSLKSCLYSLFNQRAEKQIIVTDNAVDSHIAGEQRRFADDNWCDYIHTRLPGCYHSAEVGAQRATGEYLCFPSDDSYYVPTFAETMLKAAREQDLDLVYSEMLYQYPGQGYAPLGVEPRLNRIDKTGFIIRKDKFPGFPHKQEGYCAADGLLIEQLVASGIKHGRVNSCLVVHN